MQPPPPASPGKPRSRVPDSTRHAVLPLVPGTKARPGQRRPLPDAAAVRLLIVPDPGPPYDDAVAGAGEGSPPRPRAQRGGDRRRRPDNVRQTGPAGDRQGQPGHGEQGRPERGRAVAAGWPSLFAQVLAETLAGSRPQGQITPWTTEQARRHIRQLGPMLSAGSAPRVRRVVTSLPAAGVVEMTVIVSIGPAVRALAVRLERDRQRRGHPGRAGPEPRWVCTAIEAA